MNPVLQRLGSLDGGLGLCWLGNLSWLVRSEGCLIAFDLDIDESNPGRGDERVEESPVRSVELAPLLDVQFVTHEHGDHFSEVSSAVLASQSACDFVVPANCVDKAHSLGVPCERIHVARPGGTVTVRGVTAHVQRAHHGAVTPDDCGYVVEAGGKRLYQPGDTVLLEDHLGLSDIDVLFVSPTTHTMHIGDSVRLAVELKPDYLFAQHFGTYVESDANRFWTRGYPDELAAALPQELRQRFTRPRMGEVYHVR